jgi:branched-chain amino acid transport system permease protein
MDQFLQQLFNGVMIGGIYALMGIGLTLIFGVMNVVNFAHGEFYTFGAYMLYTLFTIIGIPYILALILMVIILAVFGFVVERLLLRPIRFQPIDVNMLVLIGLSIFMANMVQVIWGPRPLDTGLPFPLIGINVGPITLTPIRVFVLLIAVLIIVGTNLFLMHTKQGKATRATFQDRDAAALMGINVDRINMLTFGFGAAVAGIAGGLLGPIFQLFPTMGTTTTAKSFAVVITGGLGSLPGAVIAGLLLGISESLGAAYLSSAYRDSIAFILIIIVLVIKPTGILGKTRRIG